jgi:hypothetical protein
MKISRLLHPFATTTPTNAALVGGLALLSDVLAIAASVLSKEVTWTVGEYLGGSVVLGSGRT